MEKPVWRPLICVNLDIYFPYVWEYEKNGVIDICPLDDLVKKVYSNSNEPRTALNIALIVREIYREYTIRSVFGEP